MIKINTPGPSGPKYDAWRKRAVTRRDKDIAGWKADGKPTPGVHPDQKRWKEIRPKQSQEIWSDFKEVFLSEIFNNKCAYCEGDHNSGFPAHVEHYRPRNVVTESRDAIDHPGYFWLAYEWENLILSCANCNSKHSSIKNGKKISHDGKLNEFRIKGKRVMEPSDDSSKWQEELKAEQPLLLNPYTEDDPIEHIGFLEDGMAYAKTEEGQETIDVCDLNRPALVSARYSWAKNVVRQRINDRMKEIETDESKKGEPYFTSSEPFSAWLNFYAEILVIELLAPFL